MPNGAIRVSPSVTVLVRAPPPALSKLSGYAAVRRIDFSVAPAPRAKSHSAVPAGESATIQWACSVHDRADQVSRQFKLASTRHKIGTQVGFWHGRGRTPTDKARIAPCSTTVARTTSQ